MSYGIEFDENDQVQLTGDERSKETGWQDATKVDSFRKSNRAIKLLLATLPRVDAEGYPEESSIGGHKLLPVGQVYVSLLNNLSSSKNVTEMISNLKEMAKNRSASSFIRDAVLVAIEGKDDFTSGYNKGLRDACKVIRDTKETSILLVGNDRLSDILVERIDMLEQNG